MIKGKWVYAEISPDACPNGHTRLGASWGQCPTCGEPVRKWPCQECDAILIDYDHVHRAVPRPDNWRL